MLFDGGDEDFSIIEDRQALVSTEENSGVVNFTSSNSGFTNLDVYGKMDYAVFMSKYNVYDKKEYAEGVAVLEKNLIERIFREGDIFAAINRINTLVLYMSFICVVLMIAAYAVLCVVNILVALFLPLPLIHNSRLINLRLLIAYTLLLSGITYLVKWFHDRTVKRIQIIQYYIK